MPDYKEMYLKMFRASEKATNILIAAQQECEELYLTALEADCSIISFPPESQGSVLEK